LALFQPEYGSRQILPYFELGKLWNWGEILALCFEALERVGPFDTRQLAEHIAAATGFDATERMRKLPIFRVAPRAFQPAEARQD
jgi:hypothetical protein